MRAAVDISVAIITYNHKNYIEQALDSVLNQKTDCTYEIVIGDDCSTDGTAEIIGRYAEKYKNIIRTVKRNKNVGPTKNLYDVISSCKGKYIVFLEGDDYYTDIYKFQKQYDFLESNENIKACAHRLEIVDKTGNHLLYTLSDLELNSFMTEKHFELYNTDMLHMNTIMLENFFIGDMEKYDIIYKSNYWSAHSLLLLMILNLTDIYVFSEPMSVWRQVNEVGATNYTSQASSKALEMYEEKIKLYKAELLYFKNSNLSLNFKKMFLLCYWNGIKKISEINPTDKAMWRKKYRAYLKKSEHIQAMFVGMVSDFSNTLNRLIHQIYRKIRR